MAVLSPDRWHRLDTLLADALACDPDARTACLRAACGDDPALYREAAALLASAEAAEAALGESAADFAALLFADAPALTQEDPVPEDLPADDLAPGTRIGPYRIEHEAGRGGMGVVYCATRADGAFAKQVALKLVKRGMDTDDVLARFHRERHVLAALDHPGIARVLDGGVAPDGRPFLAMEFVDGAPITAWCDARSLPVDERLARFDAVCEAVQHAHRRLVVHLDLKPGNVLVAETERGPEVKLLDFGIARLLDAAPDATLTQDGRRRLTPAYAAPEQRRGEPVTTAADVYALGVILHEMLVGTRPNAPPASGEPRPPSACVTPEAARARATTPERLRRRLRGDLDTVVRKALHPEAGRRYATAESLAADLRRHRLGLPVEARPDAAGYRARKFVGRHRWGVATALGAALLLAAVSVLTTVQAARLAAERDRAQQSEAFVLDLFARADPYGALGEVPTVRSVLDRGAGALAEPGAIAPEARAHLTLALGRAYYGLGAYGPALALLDTSHALYRRLHGPTDAATLSVANQRANVLRAAGRYDDATRLYRQVLDARRATTGERSPEVARALNGLALVLVMRGRGTEAEALLLDALALDRAAPHEPAHLAQTLNNLGHARLDRRDIAGAAAAYRESLTLRRALWGPEHFETSVALSNMAAVRAEQGALTDADALFRQALALRQRLVGEAHPDLALDRARYARLLHRRGDLGASEQHYRQALDVQSRGLPSEHPQLATTRAGLGLLLLERGRVPEARRLLEQAVVARRHVLGAGHWQHTEVADALRRAQVLRP